MHTHTYSLMHFIILFIYTNTKNWNPSESYSDEFLPTFDNNNSQLFFNLIILESRINSVNTTDDSISKIFLLVEYFDRISE